MNDSKFAHQTDASLYAAQRHTRSVLSSRTYTLANNIRLLIRRPMSLIAKAAKAAISDPKKLVDVITGRRILNSVSKESQREADDYLRWTIDTAMSAKELAAQRTEAQKFTYRPLVSLITPIYNPPVDALAKLIQSVIDQTYDNFELFLYNFGDNGDKDVENLLIEWAKKDKRVRVEQGLENGHISANSNYSLKHVKGEFVGLLDHDDALTEDALFVCLEALNEDKSLDFIYTDKDKISEDDVRFEGFFKPDWSPEMALGGNYLTHFDLMRTSIVKKVGGWNSLTDGAQDWDLFLKIADETDKIKHVPKIVYHWRVVKNSTAGGMTAKPYALKAQRTAVEHHLKRNGINAEPYHDAVGQMYVRWPHQNTESQIILLHCAYDDYDNLDKIYSHLVEMGIRVVILMSADTNDQFRSHKLRAETEASVVYYEIGQLTKVIRGVVDKYGSKEAFYVKDSIDDVMTLADNNWTDQLSGWLGIDNVNMIGCAVYADNGTVVDLGSVYDPTTKNFGRLHFGTGHRTGYGGYLQWIRNCIKPSEQLCVFDTALLTESIEGVRDDELITALAVQSYGAGGRAVYDPAVVARDRAKHYMIIPNSDKLDALLQQSAIGDDPFYTSRLSFDIANPRPIHRDIQRGSIECGMYTVVF